MNTIIWEQKELVLSGFTSEVKTAFKKWVVKRYLAEAKEMLEPLEYQLQVRLACSGSIFWDKQGPSCEVAVASNSDEGKAELVRLMLADQIKDWSDAKYTTFFELKNRTDSDLSQALKALWNEENAKNLAANPLIEVTA